MKLLLDTHVWVWCQESPERLGTKTRAALAADSEVFVSPVSSLEVARLCWGGRLTVTGRLRTWIDDALAALWAQTAPLSHAVAVEAYELPGGFHRDPADRLLLATARLNDMALVTADERILGYPHVRSLDASE